MDEEPLYFCSNCLSLGIIMDSGIEFCNDCGCSVIESAPLEEWERMWKERYPRKRILTPRGIFDYSRLKKNEYYN